MTAERIPVTKESKVLKSCVIPYDIIYLEKRYFHVVYALLFFYKEGGVNRKEDQADMEEYLYEEYIDDVRLNGKIEHPWRMAFEDNEGGVDDGKVILYAKMWYVHINEKQSLIKGEYSVKVMGYDGKKVLWEVTEYHFSRSQRRMMR